MGESYILCVLFDTVRMVTTLVTNRALYCLYMPICVSERCDLDNMWGYSDV